MSGADWFFVWMLYTAVCGFMAKVVTSKEPQTEKDPKTAAFALVVVSMIGGIVPTLIAFVLINEAAKLLFGSPLF